MGDDALVERAQQGDRQAMEALLEANYDLMYRFAFRWCGDVADAQDVTQLACIKLARSIGQFRFESAFSSWLYRLVINCARDWSRQQNRHRSEVATVDVDSQCSTDSPEDRIHHWQLLQALDRQPEGVKETLLLVHAEGLTHREAAEVLGVKESTVSWRLHEFRKTFSPRLAEGGAP